MKTPRAIPTVVLRSAVATVRRCSTPNSLAAADLNTTVGMALGVFILIQWVGITHKGFGVFVGEWFTAPFHALNPALKILLAPINFAFRVIEEVVRPLSLSMRLFGNMY